MFKTVIIGNSLAVQWLELSALTAGVLRLIPGQRTKWRRQWHPPLQHSCLENPMDGGAWRAAVHGVAKSQTQLSDFTFTFMHWRRKRQPTPVFLPGESQGRQSLADCRLWDRTESDATGVT